MIDIILGVTDQNSDQFVCDLHYSLKIYFNNESLRVLVLAVNAPV